MRTIVLLLALVVVALAEPTIYFKETFADEGWEERWVPSKHKSDLGKFKWTAGKFYGDADKDKGIQTSQDAHFYGRTAAFDKFTNKDKSLVIQFTVKHEQKIDCGGGYVKVFPSTVDVADMHGESPYNVMFGPDICGPGTKKVHVIFSYKGKNLLIKKEVRCKDDEFTHLYTLVVNPNNTYTVKIDNENAQSGSLEEDWDFLAPKTIPDPDAKKPEDWDDRAKIDDPEDKKPEDYDKPEYVPDPDATKPDDWDDDTDGEWEPPMVSNPDYKGEWKPRQIDNPAYKGEWVHPTISNPEYEEDDSLYMYEDFGSIGFDLWQVKSGTIFDNVLITDSEEYAEEFGNDTWGETKDPEKKMKEEQDEVERKAREAEEKKRKEEEEAAKETEEDEEDSEETPEEDEKDSKVEEPESTADKEKEAPKDEL